MSTSLIKAPKRSHLLLAIGALTKAGWTVEHAPDNGYLVRNGQRVVLKSGQEERRFRLFVYKVTGSGRNRPDERRIEITSTYQKGLRRLRDYADVVLGYDVERKLFVGVDPRRIAHGGPTGNASSFFDIAGLAWRRNDEILVGPRSVNLFPRGLEYHAFVRPSRLAEYLFNYEAIHAGTYSGAGLFAGRSPASRSSLSVSDRSASGDLLTLERPRSIGVRRRVSDQVVEAYQNGDVRALRRRKLSPEELLEIKRIMEENGRLGEEFVLNHERKSLRRAGRRDLAERVHWISRESVCEGYDIFSFELSGDEKWIEVKATTRNRRVFEMSNHEWNVCCMAGQKYYIYRVSFVRTSPAIEQFKNPKNLEDQGQISKTPTGWLVTLL